jgi:threonyl-tRNA synthetase
VQTRGELPLWLAPEQVRLIPVNRDDHVYAVEVQRQCEAAGLRVGMDHREERLGAKIYAFEKAKVPFAVILGKEETGQQTLTVRRRGERHAGQSLTLHAFLAMLNPLENTGKIGND